jgi:hypothetical protein
VAGIRTERRIEEDIPTAHVDLASLNRREVESETFDKTIRRQEMKYLLLIYDSEQSWSSLSESERERIYRDYRQLREQLQAKGQFLGGSQLQPVGTATSIRVRDGKTLVTDGPFAETHEQLGGYFLIEAKDLDEANSIAARIPSARMGTVEVRPLVERPAEATA